MKFPKKKSVISFKATKKPDVKMSEGEWLIGSLLNEKPLSEE
jgi:hypothetical protein